MTFDGQHPCRLCKLVDDCRKSDKAKDTRVQVVKLDFLSNAIPVQLWYPDAVPVLDTTLPPHHPDAEAPPLPPPLALS